jgi:hypothetical protein
VISYAENDEQSPSERLMIEQERWIFRVVYTFAIKLRNSARWAVNMLMQVAPRIMTRGLVVVEARLNSRAQTSRTKQSEDFRLRPNYSLRFFCFD